MRILLALAVIVVPFVRTSPLGAKGADGSGPQTAPADANSNDRIEQLVVVRADIWTSKVASLQRYEKDDGDRWVEVGSTLPVNLGRNGLAWGRGDRDPMAKGLAKMEGDGRSPAGHFSLGAAFGIAPHLPDEKGSYAYHQSQDNSYCVEDVRSKNYNLIVELEDDDLAVWRLRSPLRRTDGLFDWGIFVEHNTMPVEKGRGSCVFLHIWRDYPRSTAGCTSMSKASIELILGWLRRDANPHLVQLPKSEYERLREPWDLP